VSQGEVFGFLGPNGAGKLLTVRMLTSLIAPPAAGGGERYTIGQQDDDIRRTVGVLTRPRVVR